MLKEHQFVYPEESLAYLRAVVCEELGDWETAVLFHASAGLGREDRFDYLMMAVSPSLKLPSDGKLDDAWRFISRMRERIPAFPTDAVAAITLYFRATCAVEPERAELHREHLKVFDDVVKSFASLPTHRREDPAVRELMAMVYEGAGMSEMRLGTVRAETFNAAIRLHPKPHEPLFSLRGIVSYPSTESIQDFRLASLLPDCDYTPFLFLAHDAFKGGRFDECERLARIGLTKNPRHQSRAHLLSWIGICIHISGGSSDEAEKHFKHALEIDPTNEEIMANYEYFRRIKSLSQPPDVRWRMDVPTPPVEVASFERASRNFSIRKMIDPTEVVSRKAF